MGGEIDPGKIKGEIGRGKKRMKGGDIDKRGRIRGSDYSIDPLPSTVIPQCLATTTSGAVLMPTASQPISFKKRDSNGVSNEGPARWQYTPSRMNDVMFSSLATPKASWRRWLSYGLVMAGNRGPNLVKWGGIQY